MTRVLLLVPPLPFPSAGPSLSCGYLAASLIQAGHEVQVLDLAAPCGPGPADAARVIASWQPRLVGVTLLTEGARRAYDLVAGLPRGQALWVAGGVHATCVPAEPLSFGFDLVVRGEGEQTLVALADALASPGALDLAAVPGLTFRTSAGRIAASPDRPPPGELDRLPSPRLADPLFPRAWYLPQGRGALPAALLTSRGCPGRCTFCCNVVTGRRVRLHGVERVLAELRALAGEAEGPAAISIHDDAFTADRDRLLTLCRAMAERLAPRPVWWCESRVDGFDGEMARAMKQAGCTAVVFGVESGDPGVLRRIGKGITPGQVLAAFAAAKDAGLRTHANLMFGFPGEGVRELKATLELMQRMASLADGFGALGLLVPYPGTTIYRRHARTFGFERWWLDRERVAVLQRPLPPGGLRGVSAARWPALQQELEEAVLEANFFNYSNEVLQAIRECLAYRRSRAS